MGSDNNPYKPIRQERPIPLDWRERAACKGTPLSYWFPHDKDVAAGLPKDDIGKRICSTCPVRMECLAEALREEAADSTYRVGIRGGLIPAERLRLARKIRERERKE